MNDILLFISLILIFFLIWFSLKKRIGKQRATNETWREFARMKGLQEQSTGNNGNAVGDRPRFDDYMPLISFRGKSRDLPFFLECIATEGKPKRVGKFIISRGEGIGIYTRLRIGLGGHPEGFCLYRESAWSKIGKAFGMQDIATGDPSFDRLFVVKGNNQVEVLDYLTPSRRMALQGCIERYPGLDLRDGELVLIRPGQTDDMCQLEQYLSDISALSSALTG